MKVHKYTNKQIADVLKINAETVMKRIYRTKLSSCLPPKEKLQKSSIKGRLAILTKRLIQEHPKTDIPGQLRELYKVEGDLPSYKAFERFLNKSNFKIVKLLKKPFIGAINIQKRIEFAENYLE